MKTSEYLKNEIARWYENAKIDYNINGEFVKAEKRGNNLVIYHKEEGKTYATVVLYPETYTNEQIFNIWMESDWEEVA